MNYITKEEVAERILKFEKIWFQEDKPDFFVIGNEREMGIVSFKFDDGDTRQFSVYLKDKSKIKEMVEECIANFGEIVLKRLKKS